MFYSDAPKETRKSFVATAVQRFLRFRGLRVLAVTTFSVAAQLQDDGRTAHLALKIPNPVYFQGTCDAEANSQLADVLRRTNVIVWNKIVMILYNNLGAVDRTLKDFHCSALPFERIVILCVGDSRQVLPLVQAANRYQIVSACFKKCNHPRYSSVSYYTKICDCRLLKTTKTLLRTICNFVFLF